MSGWGWESLQERGVYEWVPGGPCPVTPVLRFETDPGGVWSRVPESRP